MLSLAYIIQAIVLELLNDLFSRNAGQKVTLQFLLDLVSIHPFPDYNGRLSRLYYEMASLVVFGMAPKYYISDFDLLVGVEKYSE